MNITIKTNGIEIRIEDERLSVDQYHLLLKAGLETLQRLDPRMKFDLSIVDLRNKK